MAIERIQHCVEYLDACYDAWKSVLDGYYEFRRHFLSLSPSMNEGATAEMLAKLKTQIDKKKVDLMKLWESNLLLVQGGANVEDTPPFAFTIDFDFKLLLKTAWPATTVVPQLPITQNNVPSPPKALGPIAPPVHQQVRQTNIVPSSGFNFTPKLSNLAIGLDWVQSSAPSTFKTQPQILPSASEFSKPTLDDDEFETFGNDPTGIDHLTKMKEPDLGEPVVSTLKQTTYTDLNDFDTFGPFPTANRSHLNKPKLLDNDEFEKFGDDSTDVDHLNGMGRRDVEVPLVNTPRQTTLADLDDFETFGRDGPDSPIFTPAKLAASSEAGRTNQAYSIPKDDPATVLETMRCIDFLTNKIQQKYGGEQHQTPLTKVYGHFSQEESYRSIVGGGADFADFLARYPDYFRLTANRIAVFLTRDACCRSGDAVKLAEKQFAELEKAKKKKQQEENPADKQVSEHPPTAAAKAPSMKKGPPPGLGQPAVGANMKPSLMDMDEFGDSDSSSSALKVASGDRGILDDDEFDEFGTGIGDSNIENVKPMSQPVQPRQPVFTGFAVASNKLSSSTSQPMTYWEIVEMVVKRLDLAKQFETYDVGKQVAAKAVKFAVQSHEIGQMEPDVIVNTVKEFIARGAESVKRKQQRQEDGAQAVPGIPEKTIAEWKYKTMLCSEFAANSQCLRGSSCGFAHGKNDLRPRRRVTICSLYSAGICRRTAEECMYAHGVEYLGTFLPGQEHLLVSIPQTNFASSAPMSPAKSASPAPAASTSYWKGTSTSGGSTAMNFQDTDQNCSICFHSMHDSAAGKVRRLVCGHRFHQKCFAEWKEKGQSTCPKCRIAIVDDSDFPLLS